MDTTDPVVTFSPSSGSFAAGALSVTIDWSDGYALNHNSRAITFANASGTQNVTGNFSYSTSNGTTAVSMGTVSIGTGTNTLTATICDMSEYGPNCSTQTATFSGPAPPPPSATITAETPAAVVAAGTRGALRYRLTNTGTAQGTFSMGASCPAGFADCAPSETSVMLSAGAAAWVDVSFTTPASPSNGPVQLATLSGTVSGTTTVTVPAVPSPGYPGDAASLLRIQRDACVVVSTGPGTASECGDLRVAHALPSVRVLNKARTPVLTYNSDHAWPNPIVATQFTGPAGTVPDSIRAVLLVNGTQVAQRRWKGWGASQTRRIALSFLAADTTFKTGVYAYSLVVTAEWLNGTQAPVADASRTGRMILVNRSRSPFGAGWWLSGVEQVFPLTDTEKLWVGGDGSARLYQGTSAAGPWTADAYDGVDVLTAGAGGLGYVRLLPGGAKVHFSSSGYHTATENALGHVTQFVWLPEGTPEEMRLKSIVLPSASAHPEMLSYLFEYGTLGPGCTTSTTALSRVRSPAPDSGYQDSWLCGDVSRRVTRISDPTPGSTFVTFGYYLSTRWITRRTDRRGVAQTLGYSKVRFHNAIQPLSAGVTANTVVGAVQTLGMNGVSVNADSVHIVFDGPRPGAGGLCDCLWWKVDRWGAPVSMRNILSQVTTIRRGDGRWPGLVTETVAPNGFKTTAQYDALGYLASTTAWSPYGDLRNATTILEWDAAAAAPTRIVSPEGEVTTTGYTAGRRAWEQVGASTLRRVNYQYHDASHATAPGLLRAVVAPGGATESIVYDVRGNLAASISPLGWRTESLSDRLGRVIRTRVPVDSAHTVWQQDTTIYDSVGRVRETIATGPEWRGAPPQSLHVRNHYDVASNLEMVERWSVPDAADVDTLRTRWEYDLAGRQIVEIAPDGMRDSTFYDQAGNVVRVRTRRFAESRAATQSDSAAYIWMRYDALNRLTLRIFPPVVYASRTTQIGSVVQRYPRHPTEGTGHRIPADTASYTYDPATGLQAAADNANAQVRRWYYPNGQLKHDSLFVREVETASFGSHRYGLHYRYDRAGRVTELLHPSRLLPPAAAAAGKTGNQFGYDRTTGALAWVTDPMGNPFRYHYNVRGEPDSLVLPGNVSHRYAYNPDGQLLKHDIYNLGTGGDRYGVAWLRRDSLAYEPRGKLSLSHNEDWLADTLAIAYSGLGHMAESTHRYRGIYTSTAQPTQHVAREAPVHDALGNVYRLARQGLTQVYGQGFWEKSQNTYDNVVQELGFQPGSGRQMERDAGNVSEFNHFDAAGNIVFTTEAPDLDQPGQRQDRVSYYDGGGRLWAVDLRRTDNGLARGPLYYTYEEYRLDALGRRVLVRARKSCEHHPLTNEICPMLSSVRRTVWAGDRELYEIQMPDEHGENDTAEPPTQPYIDGFDPNPFWGRVAYTYGGAIDQPLSIVRVGYKDYHHAAGIQPWPEFAIIPHWNAHGQAQTGTFHNGTADFCRGGYTDWCVKLEWADGLFPYKPGPRVPEHWHGTLVGQKRDASGLMYRRNRYYDPASGRFTQEDPIGLAGGVNVYGFANGDPVTYADPYGLSAMNCPPCEPEGGGDLALRNLQAGVDAWLNTLIEGGLAIGEGLVNLLPTGGIVQMATGRNARGERLDSSGWVMAALSAVPGGGGAAGAGARFEWKAAGHVFRNSAGHVNPQTAASRGRFATLFERVANNPANRNDNIIPAAGLAAGKKGYTQTFTGGQVWVHVFNGRITNAGVNLPGAYQ